MNKKEKEQVKREFLEKHKDTKIMVNDYGFIVSLDEYLEQESWKRK